MPGPPPKHPSRRARRNDVKRDFRALPAEGRAGDAPPWPLVDDVELVSTYEYHRDRIAGLQMALADEEDARTKARLRRELATSELTSAKLGLQLEQARDAEIELWEALWGTPQAVMWEESHAHRSVALYVRMQIKGEQGDLKAAGEARQREDRLGLNSLALLRLRAEVERVEEAADRGERRRSTRKPPKGDGDDPRTLLRAVE